MGDDSENSFVVPRSADTSLSISLHPLVLLTASDLITRHRVRGDDGPVTGILLGQQKGQEVTAEHAFAANLIKSENGSWIMHQDWTQTRIQQFKDVHKAPALEAVGWFALTPESGPLPENVVIQRQFERLFNENAIFLAIHPSALSSTDTTNRKLPLTIYEGVSETEEASMQVDGEEHANIKFRPLLYTIETDETEMIAIDYVAKGAGSAASVENSVAVPAGSTEVKTDTKGKGRADAVASEKPSTGANEQSSLTTEEEDQVAGMTTRLNSVKMLQSRLQIISRFVQSLSPSYISDQTIPLTSSSPEPTQMPHLRNIQALMTRLSLLTPSGETNIQEPAASTSDALQDATRSESNDVSLISMLSQLGQDVQKLSELGRKFAQVEQGKTFRGRKNGGFATGGYGGMEENDGQGGRFAVANSMLM